jgi:holo-[acyl-carrier protein] synthase
VILGIGTDLCRVDRIRRSLNRFGDTWIEELFTTEERAWCLAKSDPGLLFAKAFCCKEACAKAMGTGFAKKVDPRDIELPGLSSAASATPIILCGKARSRVRTMTPSGHESKFFVTISGDHLVVSAVVFIEAVPM